MKCIHFFVLILILCPAILPGDDIYVPADYTTIQAGINAAQNGDTVWVADGTYYNAGNRDLDFGGKSITVRSENGPEHCVIDCAAHESNPHRGFEFFHGENRNAVVDGFTIKRGWVYSKTNGFLKNGGAIYCTNSSSPTIRNCVMTNNRAVNDGGAVYCGNSCNPLISNCEIVGNECTGADAWEPWNIINGNGGGVACMEGSPTIENCNISDNYLIQEYAITGGGIYIYKAHPEITNCLISGNEAGEKGGGIYASDCKPWLTDCVITGNTAPEGAGIYLDTNKAHTITGCTFSENQAALYGGGAYMEVEQTEISDCLFWNNTASQGAGVYYYMNSSPAFRACYFYENTASDAGGGIFGHGGAYPEDGVQSWIIGCHITANSANNGAGIYIRNQVHAVIHDCVISSNTGTGIYCNDCRPDIVNCLITGNSTHSSGGGLYCLSNAEPTLVNCTFAGNGADEYGGGLGCRDSFPTVVNTIFWDNAAPSGPEIWVGSLSGASTLAISYSDVRGGQGLVQVDTDCTLNWLSGMIEENPLFTSIPSGDYHLMQPVHGGISMVSPCVDAGDPASDMIAGSTRIDRLQDRGVVDMGYHYRPAFKDGAEFTR
jgi:predicted outer membrane repeat protein